MLKTQQFKDLVDNVQNTKTDKELHWLSTSIITPEFPQIIEALHICSNLLLYNSPQHPDAKNRIERGPTIKLPVSSNKSEVLKGIVVRDGAYLTHLTVTLKEPHFNKVINRLNLKKPMLLPQIITSKKCIDQAIATIEELSSIADDCSIINHDKLIKSFKLLLNYIQTAKNSLQLPTDPNLVFPVNITPINSFEPELIPTITVDAYISQAEICLDLKSLHKVTEKPWGEIESSTGKSYIDKIRDEMKLPGKNSSSSSSPLSVQDIEKRLNEMTGSDQLQHTQEQQIGSSQAQVQPQATLFSSVMSHLSLRPRHDPLDYITKCITYNNMVVMVNKKIEVSSPDPVLVSAFTKLDSIEYLISSFLNNLDCLLDSI
ncbi:RAVE subunit 2/Rogdi [Scheffersomyces coipomensis]|uniref:RAVE subunit 2/Rogdi n=1 Tax=Scheffersomyces coipomensis TaxID=1788519 RepID=UPI00315DEAFB